MALGDKYDGCHAVVPVAEESHSPRLDSRLRGNDGKGERLLGKQEWIPACAGMTDGTRE
jgi:hypothetical protein